jgi:hypothetical protein
MGPRRVRVIAVVDGAYRALYSVLERPNGELLIPITNSGRHSNGKTFEYETAAAILEDRISVHLSPNSKDLTTIKRTKVLGDGSRITSVALTDAVKRKSGFSGIFVRRYENLSGDGYAPVGKAKVGNRVLVLPEHDPRYQTMFSGLFLGGPEAEFRVANDDPMLHIEPIKFRNFQLVAMFSLQPFRSHYTSEMGTFVTFDPLAGPESTVAVSDYLMRGKSARGCLVQYQNAVWAMSRRVLKIELKQAADESAVKDIKKRLRQMPKPVLRLDRRSRNRPATLLYPTGCFSPSKTPTNRK